MGLHPHRARCWHPAPDDGDGRPGPTVGAAATKGLGEYGAVREASGVAVAVWSFTLHRPPPSRTWVEGEKKIYRVLSRRASQLVYGHPRAPPSLLSDLRHTLADGRPKDARICVTGRGLWQTGCHDRQSTRIGVGGCIRNVAYVTFVASL